jgi:iron complex outermembrane recepter protein
MSEISRLKSVLLAGACAFLAMPAMAQAPAAAPATPAAAPAEEPVGEEEVVVTGSRIRGTPENAALPVDVIGKEELTKRGSPSTLELIKSLPVVTSIQGETNQFSGFAQGIPGVGSINLRGLGPQRTLVLLNGKRLPQTPTPQATGVDTNMIPSAAIGRVEVLKDGAAAVYGSDAIGGVVNFITKRNFEGWTASADYRYIKGSSGDYTGSVAYGKVWDNGNIFLSAGLQHRSELSMLERDWAFLPPNVNPSGWSVYGSPGAWIPRTGVLPAFPTVLPNGAAGGVLGAPTGGVTVDANCNAVGGVSGFSGTTPVCRFSFIPFDNLVEKERRYQLYGEINFEFEGGTRFHGEVLYANTLTPAWRTSPAYPPFTGLAGPSTSFTFSVPRENPGFLTALQQAGLSAPAIAATNNIGLGLYRPLGWFGNPNTGGKGGQTDRIDRDLWRVAGTLEGNLGGNTRWEIGLTYSIYQTSSEIPDILAFRLDAALRGFGGPNCTGNVPGANGCLWFNPFSNGYPGNPALGLANPGFVPANANNPAVVDWIYDRQYTSQQQDLFVVDAGLDGEFSWELPGGKIGWALGAQYRTTDYLRTVGSPFYDPNVTPCAQPGVTNCAVRTGPYIFLGQAAPVVVTQKVWAVFGELNIPFTDKFNVQAAVRYENYGGGTGSTVNPKLAFKWQVIDWLAFRGSVGTTFRGPTPLNTDGGTVTGLVSLPATGGGFRAVDTTSNRNLAPEKADTYNFGLIVETSSIRFIVDYWKFKLKDQIITPGGVPISNNAFVAGALPGAASLINCASPLRPLIVLDNNNVCTQGVTNGGNISRVQQIVTNGPTVDTSGLDITLDYTQDDVWGGTLGLGISASHILEYKQADFLVNGVNILPAFAAAGNANYDRPVQTIPKWRGSFYVNYQKDIHNIRMTVNYVAGVTDNRPDTFFPIASGCNNTAANPACQLVTFGNKVKSNTTVDLTYTAELPWDTQLQLSIFNVLDQDPSPARLEASFDPYFGSPVGRSFKIGLTKNF